MTTTDNNSLTQRTTLSDTWIKGIFGREMTPPLREVVRRTTGLAELERLYSDLPLAAATSFAPDALARLSIGLEIEGADLERIPKSGPVIFVSNHPSGMLDGLLLDAAIQRVRSDAKVLANALLCSIPQLSGRYLPLKVIGTGCPERNAGSMLGAVRHLKAGGALLMFPAGEVSHVQFREFRVTDQAWDDSVARLAGMTNASVIPVHIGAANSFGFQVAGIIHPGLRTLRLPGELLNKRGRTVRISVGWPIQSKVLEGFGSPQQATEYLRGRTYLLAHRARSGREGCEAGRWPVVPAPDAVRYEAGFIAENGGLIVESGKFQVLFASGSRLRALLPEIGRLREKTFRNAGEGTGNELDLDRHDTTYSHLFLWDREAGAVAGAYRLAWTADILASGGVEGLYTSTLFRYSRRFFERLGPSVELGRSFIRLEYQRDFTPLLLLWQAIGRCVASRPEAPVLFGAVSVSDRYAGASRDLIATFLDRRCRNAELSRCVSPRLPYRARTVHGNDIEAVLRGITDVEALAGPLKDLGDQAGVPVLLRQYLKLGGQIAATNLDPHFSGVLDALIVVDLRKTEPKLLGRYMGHEQAAAFRRHHGLVSALSQPGSA